MAPPMYNNFNLADNSNLFAFLTNEVHDEKCVFIETDSVTKKNLSSVLAIKH